MLTGMAKNTVPKFVKTHNIGAVVYDFSPLRVPLPWVEDVHKGLPPDVPLCQVDAHNGAPLWVTSDKQEYATRTIRNKVNNNLSTYLTEFPPVIKHPHEANFKAERINWGALLETLDVDRSVDEVSWAIPGYNGGINMLQSFVEKRLRKFNTKRNDPTDDDPSNLSPWFHFGEISVQRCVLAVKKYGKNFFKSVSAFCEEAIVRRELADNFCYYNKQCDSLDGAYVRAQKTLNDHRKDKRAYLYTRDKLERAETHDDRWNSAQLQMVKEGKMHCFLRMYWAEKKSRVD